MKPKILTDIIDLISNKVNKSDISNSLSEVSSDKVLDARQGKVLQERISTLENDMSGVKQFGDNWKSEIAGAITAKGVTTSATDTKETFKNNIESITDNKGVIVKNRQDMVGIAAENIVQGDILYPEERGSMPIYSIPTPSVIPNSAVRGVAISPDGQHIAMCTAESEFLYVYKIQSDETLVRIACPPTPSLSYACNYSPDGKFLAVGFNMSPYIYIYKRSGDTYTRIASPESSPLVNGCAFSNNGQYFITSSSQAPYIAVYKVSGDTFTKISNPTVAPHGGGYGCEFSPCDNYLAVACAGEPYVLIYKRNGDTFTALPTPNATPTYIGRFCSFSPNGEFLALGSASGSCSIIIYKRSGDTFTKLDTFVTSSGAAFGVKFNKDGTLLAASASLPPYVVLYTVKGDVFTRVSDPETIPSNTAYGCVFTNKNSVFHGTLNHPFVYGYKTNIHNVWNKFNGEYKLPLAVALSSGNANNNINISIMKDTQI